MNRPFSTNISRKVKYLAKIITGKMYNLCFHYTSKFQNSNQADVWGRDTASATAWSSRSFNLKCLRWVFSQVSVCILHLALLFHTLWISYPTKILVVIIYPRAIVGKKRKKTASVYSQHSPPPRDFWGIWSPTMILDNLREIACAWLPPVLVYFNPFLLVCCWMSRA